MQRFEKIEMVVGRALQLVHFRHRSALKYDGLRFPRDFAGDILCKESELFVRLDDVSDVFVLKEDHSQALASTCRDFLNLTNSQVKVIASLGQQLQSVEHQVNKTFDVVIGLSADISARLQSMEGILRSLPADMAEKLDKIWEDKLTQIEEAVLSKNKRRTGLHLASLSEVSHTRTVWPPLKRT